MKIEKKRFEDIVILTLTGELDSFNLPTLTDLIEERIQAGDRNFILDARLLTFMNSAAFGYIMSHTRRLADQGGKLAIARPSKFVRKTVKTFGAEQFLSLYPTVEDALLAIRSGIDTSRLHDVLAAPVAASLGEVDVLFRAQLEGREQPHNKVGRVVSLYEDGLLFHYDADGTLDPAELELSTGTVLKLKFRQPFVEKKKYFTMDAEVKHVDVFTEPEDGGPRTLAVLTEWSKISDEDREALSRFVKDQAEWRKEVKR